MTLNIVKTTAYAHQISLIYHPCILPSRTLANAKGAKICQEKNGIGARKWRLRPLTLFRIPPKISNNFCYDFEASKPIQWFRATWAELCALVSLGSSHVGRGHRQHGLGCNGRNAVALELTDRRIDRRKGPCHRPSHHHWQQPQGNPRTIEALRTIPSHRLTKHCWHMTLCRAPPQHRPDSTKHVPGPHDHMPKRNWKLEYNMLVVYMYVRITFKYKKICQVINPFCHKSFWKTSFGCFFLLESGNCSKHWQKTFGSE